MMSKQYKTDKLIYVCLFLIAFAFVFSSTYNPFNFRRMHVDSSVYMSIAQGIIRGQLPYRDFVDNKGPLAYLLSVPGLALGGFTGVWITELILVGIAVLFAWKTALFFTGKYKALLGTLCCFVVALAFFTVCAGTEEYTLPFLMVSLYLFTKYYFSPQKDISLPELITLGICFACAVLIRLNTFPLWAGFCVVIFVSTIIKRRFMLLGKYIAGFCIGMLLVCAPVYFYLKQNGILADFLDQVIFGGAAQGFSGASIKQTAKNFYIVINRNFSFAPFFWGVFLILTKYRKSDFPYYLAYTLSCILMILFLSFSSGDSHYNMVLVPFFIPMLASFAGPLYSAFSQIKRKNIAIGVLLCIVFSEGLIKYTDDLAEIFHNDSGRQLINAGKMIDENTMPGDKIISLGINGYIYPFTQRQAASRYIYQGSGVDHFPRAREEFISDIINNKPAIIAIFSAEEGGYDYLPGWYAPVYALIERDYRLLSDENGYFLFVHN